MDFDYFFHCLRNGKKWLAVLLIFLTVHGLAGFACFICEESMQTAMFGAFAYGDDVNGLSEHLKVMKSVHETSELIIYTVGWFAPLMQTGYISYLQSDEAYIKATENKIKNSRH